MRLIIIESLLTPLLAIHRRFVSSSSAFYHNYAEHVTSNANINSLFSFGCLFDFAGQESFEHMIFSKNEILHSF